MFCKHASEDSAQRRTQTRPCRTTDAQINASQLFSCGRINPMSIPNPGQPRTTFGHMPRPLARPSSSRVCPSSVHSRNHIGWAMSFLTLDGAQYAKHVRSSYLDAAPITAVLPLEQMAALCFWRNTADWPRWDLGQAPAAPPRLRRDRHLGKLQQEPGGSAKMSRPQTQLVEAQMLATHPCWPEKNASI